MSSPIPDSPWTSKLKTSKEQSLQRAVLAAKEEEELELASRSELDLSLSFLVPLLYGTSYLQKYIWMSGYSHCSSYEIRSR